MILSENALTFAETLSSINRFTSSKHLLADVVSSIAGRISCAEAHSHEDELSFLQLFFQNIISQSLGALTVEHSQEAYGGPATPWLPGLLCGAAASGSLKWD